MLFISAIILVFIQSNYYPLKFRVDEKDPTEIYDFIIYNDLNHDDLSKKTDSATLKYFS